MITLRNLLLAAAMAGVSPSASAQQNFINLIQVDPGPDATLEELVDDFTTEFVRRLINEDDELDGENVVATETGFVIRPYLVVDLSKLTDTMRNKLIARLRRIFLDGETWGGLTYAFDPGRLGITPDIVATSARIEAMYAEHPAEIDLTQVCDHWLGQDGN